MAGEVDLDAPSETEAETPRRSPPTSFRLGELEGEVNKRRRHEVGESAAAVIRRDLGRYYAAARQSVAQLHFSYGEAMLLAMALKATPLAPTTVKYLWAEVDEWFRLVAKPAKFHERWPDFDALSQGIVTKLRDLPPIGQLAVLDAVEIFNAHMADNSPFDAAHISGLTYDIDPETESSLIQAAVARGDLAPE